MITERLIAIVTTENHLTTATVESCRMWVQDVARANVTATPLRGFSVVTESTQIVEEPGDEPRELARITHDPMAASHYGEGGFDPVAADALVWELGYQRSGSWTPTERGWAAELSGPRDAVAAADVADRDPVGLEEIAARLGVERGTADKWRTRGLLPAPVWTVGGRPAWPWAVIEEWARSTGRMPA